MKLFEPKDIKIHVANYLRKYKAHFKDKIVIDTPAGSGVSSQILQEIGAKVKAYDLFPEFFKVEGLTCEKADLIEGLPLENESADVILCQEGIEHFSDQIKVLQEFNRVLKKSGTLIITTPNYSNLRSRLSYMLAESEYFYKIMPPNEIDSIWLSGNQANQAQEIYYGHIFLLGIQKLRVMSKLAGFKIRKIHHVRVNHTSLFLLLFWYPWIYLTNQLAYIRALKKRKDVDKNFKKKVYQENLKLGLDTRVLIGTHLFVELEKETEIAELSNQLQGKYSNFDVVT